MNKMLAVILLSAISSGTFGQPVGRVDRKTKEFSILPGQKVQYMIFGYQYANATTQKLICFASSVDVERANANLRLGSYFDTDGLPPGGKITWLGMVGPFAKMIFMTGAGKSAVFYMPRASFVMK